MVQARKTQYFTFDYMLVKEVSLAKVVVTHVHELPHVCNEILLAAVDFTHVLLMCCNL